MTDPISELEEMVQGEEPEEKLDESSLVLSTIAYQIAIVVIDSLTGFTIAMISYWYYGVVWFLAGAISFFIHHKNWGSPRNNQKQVDNAKLGMIVSVASMFLMAISAAVVFVAQITSPLIEVVIVGAVIILFFWHSFQVAMYRFADDKFVIARAIARARGIADKKIKIAKAGGQVVAANKKALQEKKNQYARHGDRGAVDAAIRGIQGAPHPVIFGDEVDGESLDRNNHSKINPQ